MTILLAWLLADFISGMFHWFEDRYMSGKYSLNFLNSIAEENDLHHNKPTAMTVNSAWTNVKSGIAVSIPLGLLLWALSLPTVIWLGIMLSGLGNLVHRWSHIPKRKLNWAIRFMQRTGLFISHEHHDSHHRSMNQLIPKHIAGYRFCPMTNWVNPVVDYLKVWNAFEVVFSFLGLKTTQARG